MVGPSIVALILKCIMPISSIMGFLLEGMIFIILYVICLYCFTIRENEREGINKWILSFWRRFVN